MKSRCFPLILLISLASSARGTVQVEKTLLMKLTPEQSGTISTKGIEKVFTFSSDGLHVLFSTPDRVTIDGVESEKYDAVYGARFSPDGKHTAYAVLLNYKYFAVIDGRRSPEYDIMDCYVQKPDAPQTIVYTPDSQHWAYVAKEGKSWFAVVDGQRRPGPDVKITMAISPVLTPDGNHVAFIGLTGMSPDIRYIVVVDGQVQPAPETGYSKVEGLVLSPDGKHWAYKAQLTNRKWLVVADGQAGPEYSEIPGGWPAFTPDGKHLAYLAHTLDKWVLVTDGQPSPEYRIIKDVIFSRDGSKTIYRVLQGEDMNLVLNGQAILRSWDWLFSPDEKHYSYLAGKGRDTLVVWDGKEGPGFDSVGGPLFSSDGTRMAYFGIKGKKKECAVVDGVPGPDYEQVTGPVFSGDGKHVAYSAMSRKKWMTIIDGTAGPKFDDIGFTNNGITIYDWITPSSPALSFDGSRVAYGIRQEGRTCVWVDGTLGPEVKRLPSPPLFSPDGKHVAYIASTVKDGMFAVLDGQPGPGLPSIIPSYQIHFNADNSVEYLGRTGAGSPEGDAVYRVKLTPVQ